MMVLLLAAAVELARPEAALVASVEMIAHEYGEAAESLEDDRAVVLGMIEHALELGRAQERTRRFVPALEEIRGAIQERQQPFRIDRLCETLSAELVRAGKLTRAPSHRPDLRRGQRLYAAACATCHGTPLRPPRMAAPWLDPPAPDLAAPETLNGMSPARLYDVVTYGVHGTAMPSFAGLAERDRWAVAFYAFTLALPRCHTVPPSLPLARLATTTNGALVAAYGEAALPCLRQMSPAPRSAQLRR